MCGNRGGKKEPAGIVRFFKVIYFLYIIYTDED